MQNTQVVRKATSRSRIIDTAARLLDGAYIRWGRAPVLRKKLWRWILNEYPDQLLSEGSRDRTPDYSESLTSQECQIYGMLGDGFGDCGSLPLV